MISSKDVFYLKIILSFPLEIELNYDLNLQ
jgi:hypothetical protein